MRRVTRSNTLLAERGDEHPADRLVAQAVEQGFPATIEDPDVLRTTSGIVHRTGAAK